MALVELRGVSKTFRKGEETITPLDNISLDIDTGEFVSLMGPSGTGKSTLLNLVSGIDRPDSGTITVDGTDVTKLTRTQLADWRAANLGYIFQTHNLIPVLTAYENVELPTLLLKLSSVQRRQRVELALEAVGLSDRANHYPRQLSGGQEQRVGIARAIVAHPKVVVADEPTGSLDAETSEQVQVLLQRLNRELNITMLMVTHDSNIADDSLCSQDPVASSHTNSVNGHGISSCHVCFLFCWFRAGRAESADHGLGCRSNLDCFSGESFLPYNKPIARGLFAKDQGDSWCA